MASKRQRDGLALWVRQTKPRNDESRIQLVVDAIGDSHTLGEWGADDCEDASWADVVLELAQSDADARAQVTKYRVLHIRDDATRGTHILRLRPEDPDEKIDSHDGSVTGVIAQQQRQIADLHRVVLDLVKQSKDSNEMQRALLTQAYDRIRELEEQRAGAVDKLLDAESKANAITVPGNPAADEAFKQILAAVGPQIVQRMLAGEA